jgi:regulator of protease activity HflC (stomatin/prohibitin superfamily)
MQERTIRTFPGILALGVAFAAFIGGICAMAEADNVYADERGLYVLGGFALWLAALFALKGMFTMAPNESRVMQLFGGYAGTVRAEGWRWVNPFYSKRNLSLRMRNFETARIKVNDLEGNPIEIAAIVVWKVVDTARACFVVDDFASYVHVQAEAAVRNLATHHPYDAHDDSISLRGHTDEVAKQLAKEIQTRCEAAGVEILEARIGHLAYAPEIAHAMLQRQQAGAIIAARTRIVEGAVGMVELALAQLARNKIVDLDEDRKAAMVSNLLVVLCGDRSTQPVINAGTLHQG